LCALCKQEDGEKSDKEMWDVTEWSVWKWLTVEGKRAKYEAEMKSLRQQLKKEMSEHKVS
jgi:hypothetical protein